MVITMIDGCPVCAAKGLGSANIRLCNLGKKTAYQVAEELHCTYEQVMTHINECHELRENQQGKLETSDVLLRRLSNNMETLQEWTDYIITTVSSPEQVDRNKVQMLTQLTKEIRGAIGDIAELQGRKGPGDAYMQVQVLNARVVDLTNTILSECCDECKLKILNRMEQQPPMLAGGGHEAPRLVR